ncbi:unnamed protein product, partial [Closterium sp. NIES-53]
SGVAIFDLDYDAILAAMYDLSASTEGGCYLCVPPDPGIDAAALGASESVLPGTAPAEALQTFTLDSGASRWSSLYTLATKSPQVAASAQVSALGHVAPPCSCRLLSHQTLLWHHRLGHPSLPRLRGMHSHLLVSGLPRSLPPLPPSPAPPYLPCVEGRQRATPHFSSVPLMTPPLQTLHMDMWGPARVSGESREQYFPLVVDDYTWYATVFPLRSKGQVVDVLIPWIHAVRLQLRERFRTALPILLLHCDRGGEFSSDLLREFCGGEGILQSFTLPDSPRQNRIAERRIGLVMEVTRTSMIHAVAPHFLWPFAVRYAAHQLNLWPHVSSQETSPTLRWTGKFGDASSGGLTKHCERASRPVSLVCTARSVPRLRPPPVLSTHAMALHPSSVPLHVPLPPPPESSRPAVLDPESDLVRVASVKICTSPNVSRLLATVVTDPSFESTAASALVAELLDFAAASRLDYATALVAESKSASPSSVGGECALGTDVLEDTQEDFECLAPAVPRFASTLLAPEGDPDAPHIPTPRSYVEAITGPYSSQWQAAMDAEMASWKSTGTYVDAAPPYGAKIVDGMWIFRVKRPPGSPPAFKGRYVARGFSQRQGVDYFHTFSPTPKMTTLRVLLHVAAQLDYELHSLDFSTAFLQGSLHEEIWLRYPPGFTGTTLAALGFTPSTADPLLFLRADTLLPLFYVVVYVDDLVFATADTEALTLVKSELQKRHTCTDLGELRSYLGLSFSASTSSSRRHSPFLCLAATRSQLHLRTSPTSGMGLVLGGRGLVVLTGHADASSCQAEIYARAMAAQELRWLTYLLTDLGEQPRLHLVLYLDNKAMIALCQEHRLEHRTKHIALRYFLARELQQRGQLRLAYVATWANTADIFTKALPPGDHQRFSTV